MKRILAALVTSFSLMAITEGAEASFTTIVGMDSTYCAVGNECLPPEYCVVEDLQIGISPCYATCTYPNCWFESTAEGYVGWETYGEMPSYCLGDIVGCAASLNVSAERVHQYTLTVNGYYECNCFSNFGGTAETAVVRFEGDPAAFLGLIPKTVDDLVASGLIEEADILYLKNDFPCSELGWAEFSRHVAVRDIPDGEIYLFSTVQAPEPARFAMILAGLGVLCGLNGVRGFGARGNRNSAPR